MALAPDPFDDEIEWQLADPDVLRRLDELEERRQRGELVLHDDAEVRSRLEDGPIRPGADGEVRTPGLPLTTRVAAVMLMGQRNRLSGWPRKVA